MARWLPEIDVTGVDSSRDNIDLSRRRRGLSTGGVEKCRFIRDMAERAARLAAGKTDLLVIHPPRSGMSADAVAAVRRIRPERIAYVSCNPSTLARGLKGLGGTYRAREVIPFDFFPHTAHFEALALLKRA